MDSDGIELSKAAIAELIKPVADLVDKLFGGAAEEIGGAWKDQFAARRLMRRVAIYKKVKAAFDKAGVEPQQIPDNIWLPALQEASLQDDETIQEKWANLLANAAVPRQNNFVSPSFISILKELTAREARFLDSLYRRASDSKDPFPKPPSDIAFTSIDLSEVYADARLSRRPRLLNLSVGEIRQGGDDLRADLAEFTSTIDLLTRNGVLKASIEPQPIEVSKYVNANLKHLPRSVEVKATTFYYITELGAQFIRACRAPSQSE